MKICAVLVVVMVLCPLVSCSAGDRSFAFQKCGDRCMKINCTRSHIKTFSDEQPTSHKFLGWSCGDECNYICMWKTVDAFQRDGMPVPQFFGKWPFIRVLGIQEPASVVFSVLNWLAHLSILKYRRLVPATAPLYYVIHLVAAMSLNAWTWSVVFHCKDTPFTEKMDYFCAFSLVLGNTFYLVCRLGVLPTNCAQWTADNLDKISMVLGTQIWWRPLVFAAACIVFFVQHVMYLTYNRFDYGYNMRVNLTVAAFNVVGWLTWCATRWRQQSYVWKCVTTAIGLQLCLSLELFDFPPILWTFDAHSLWHAATPVFILLIYSFIIDDSHYMMEKRIRLPQKQD